MSTDKRDIDDRPEPVFCPECGQHVGWRHLISCSRHGRRVALADAKR